MLVILTGCPAPPAEENTSDSNPEGDSGGETQDRYSYPETLAKRYVLYKIAYQEGDLAPYMALYDSVANMNLPSLAVQVNRLWWQTDYESTRLAPLSAQEITTLESVVSPYIQARMDEEDPENHWVKFIMACDPLDLQTVISHAHTDWIPEQRELYTATLEDDCYQVWCAEIHGEWKIVAQFICEDETGKPTVPLMPEELLNYRIDLSGEEQNDEDDN